MWVFKFGGASIKNSQAIRNMASLLSKHSQEPLLVVVSAMDKTTNALEKVLSEFRAKGKYQDEIKKIKSFHKQIIDELFEKPEAITHFLNEYIDKIDAELSLDSANEDKIYDAIVSQGELLSSRIISEYLNEVGVQNEWRDARDLIITDNTFREGSVNWEVTAKRISPLKNNLKNTIIVTQGFIGADAYGNTTTLGREGSDFTAAIFASCLDAEAVTIWKDVPGVMSADPKRLPDPIVFSELPYKEAAEMTYYGASVIHPKTIKPLALKGIPLHVKSFINPDLPGTKIHDCKIDRLPPLIVFKDNQCLISCKVTDYTFVNEQQLGNIFHVLSDLNVKLNVMQNSAISFSFCIDFRESKLEALIEKLQHHFEVYYNTDLTLITIKNYDDHSFDEYRKRSGILLEQSSRSTLQVLLKL